LIDGSVEEELTATPPTQAMTEPPPKQYAQETPRQELEIEPDRQPQLLRGLMGPTGLLKYTLLGLGLLALAVAVLFKSTNLVFVGLGLTFWGALLFFVQPRQYVGLEVMNTAGLSSLESLDKALVDFGYRERGVYIPPEGPRGVVVFIPSKSPSRIQQSIGYEGKIPVNQPERLFLIPPGLALANLIEKTLGFDLKKEGVDGLIKNLRKVLVEDLDLVRDVETKMEGELVKFRLIGSKYAKFCEEFDKTSSGAGFGCPMCSALACLLTIASGKPVRFEEDELSVEKGTIESCYQLFKQKD
jgi:hypothetical protein